MLTACAGLGFVPPAHDLHAIFEAALSQGVRGFTVEEGTSSTIDDVFMALKIIGTELPGGLDALMQHQASYAAGCDVLLQALLLLPPNRVRGSNVGNIFRMASVLSRTAPPLLAPAAVQAYVPRLLNLAAEPAVLGRLNRADKAVLQVVLCEGLAILDAPEHAPLVLERYRQASTLLHYKGGWERLRRKNKAALWRVYQWLKRAGIKPRVFSVQQLEECKAASAALEAYILKSESSWRGANML